MKTHFPSRQLIFSNKSRVSGEQDSQSLAPSAVVSESLTEEYTPKLLAAVAGINDPPELMLLQEIKLLGDLFSRDILLKELYPLTLLELVEAIESIAGFDLQRKMFLVAEGGQFRLDNQNFEPNARLVFSWKNVNSSTPEFLLSTVPKLNSSASLLQLISWSTTDESFHFFERKNGIWGWAGNSFHALGKPSRGKGPFDSHINGSLVMKELKFPWTHWHSMSSSIPREIFDTNSEFNSHSLFSRVDGAEELEGIVTSGIRRWTKSRFGKDLADIANMDVRSYVRQLLTPSSANLISSSTEFDRAENAVIKIPTSFIFDVAGLEAATILIDPFNAVVPSGKVEVDGNSYLKAIERLRLHVESENRMARIEGDTHFCFLVPERAFEDTEVVKQLMENGFISPKLVICLLMVDFINPIKSIRRNNLVKYFPESISSIEDIEGAFLTSLNQADITVGSAEEEFLSYWESNDLLNLVKSLLTTFLNGLQAEMGSDDGVFKLALFAEGRKDIFRKRLLNEFISTTSKAGVQVGEAVNIDINGKLQILVED